MAVDRILITGAGGFVGQGLVAQLRDRPLTIATRMGNGEADGIRRVAVGGVGRETEWAHALAGVSAVVHLAGHVHIAPEQAEHEAALFDEVNHLGSLRLFRAAQKAGASLFVQVSSITVLGTATTPGQPFNDASAPDPNGPYARSKLAAEQALTAAAQDGPTRLVILRPPLIAGPGVKGNLARLIRLAALPVPLPLGRLRNRRTLLSRDNLVAAIGAVLQRGAEAPAGTYVLGDGDPVSTSDIVAALRQGLGRRPMLLPAPLPVIRPALAALGARGAYTRLFGDLEVDSTGFRRAFAFDDLVETRDTLRRTAAASRR